MTRFRTALAVIACVVMMGQAANAQATRAPVVSWTGFYAGLHAGWGQTSGGPGASSMSSANFSLPLYETQNLDLNGNGLLYGGQAGFNWQISPNLVVGIEGDITGSTLRGSATGTPVCALPNCVPFAGAVSQSMERDVRWLASVRGRLGYTWGPGMIYVTGGAAWANINYSGNGDDTIFLCGARVGLPNCSYPASLQVTTAGWTIGGGYETMIAANWTLRTEYLFYSFGGGTTLSAVGSPPCWVPTCSSTYSFTGFDLHTARVGVNYRF